MAALALLCGGTRRRSNNRFAETAAVLSAALIFSIAGCAPLTPEQREYDLRVFEMFNQRQMNQEFSGAVPSLGCNVRDYCY